MEIKFIGTGGAFDYKYLNSSALITCNGKKYLLDCGNRIYSRLCELGQADAMDAILITHTHDDHVGSLASLILHQKHVAKRDIPLIIYYPDLQFKMTLLNYLSFAFRPVEEYVRLMPLEDIGFINAIDTKGMHVKWMQTWGYVFEEGNETIAYSGDLGNEEVIFDFLKKKGKVGSTVFHEINFNAEVDNHSYYKKLEERMGEFRIFGYHCDPRQKPDDCKIPLVADQPSLLMH